ncbi:MAG: hypothetical protein KC731_24095 [Myxococcales bacterium]|nr:hypothetical protein [Myxococcales bacterium]
MPIRTKTWCTCLLVLATAACGDDDTDSPNPNAPGTGGTGQGGGLGLGPLCNESEVTFAAPVAFAHAGGKLFVADAGAGNDGRLIAVDEGCAGTKILADGLSGLVDVVAGGGRVQWRDAAGFHSVPAEGGAVVTLEGLANPSSTFGALASDDDHVYATDGTSVVRWPHTGGAAESVTTIQCGATDLALSGADLFITQGGCGGDVLRIPKAGGPLPETISNLQYSDEVVTNGTYLVWSRYEVGALSILKLGESVAHVYRLIIPSDRLAIDADFVYVNTKDDTFDAVPLEGGPSVVMAKSVTRAQISDGERVYWTDGSDVFSAPRPVPEVTGPPTGDGDLHLSWVYPPDGCGAQPASLLLLGPTTLNVATTCDRYELLLENLAPGDYSFTMDVDESGITTRFESIDFSVGASGVTEFGPFDLSPPMAP